MSRIAAGLFPTRTVYWFFARPQFPSDAPTTATVLLRVEPGLDCRRYLRSGFRGADCGYFVARSIPGAGELWGDGKDRPQPGRAQHVRRPIQNSHRPDGPRGASVPVPAQSAVPV